MMRREKAVLINKLGKLRRYAHGFDRIYFGNEFCQNLIPSAGDIEAALDFSQKNGANFTFVTPFVTELGLEKLDKLFQLLNARQNTIEIVVNDWGVLEVLSKGYKNLSLSLGRLLTRQNCDPAVKSFFEKRPPVATKTQDGEIKILLHVPLSEKERNTMGASHVNSFSVQQFLSKMRVKRVELNNIAQGLNLENISLKCSLYTPYVNISTARFCPMETAFQKLYRINVCKKECQRYYYLLRKKHRSIYKRGNTIFYRNPIKTRELDRYPIVDRVVFQPELPF